MKKKKKKKKKKQSQPKDQVGLRAAAEVTGIGCGRPQGNSGLTALVGELLTRTARQRLEKFPGSDKTKSR